MTNLRPDGDIDIQEPDNKIPGPASSTPRPDDLDERLWKLLQKYFDKYNPYDGEAEQTIAAIKEAFKKAGWRKTHYSVKSWERSLKQNGFLSGQEWFDRFWSDFMRTPVEVLVAHPVNVLDYVLEAAKRASGLA